MPTLKLFFVNHTHNVYETLALTRHYVRIVPPPLTPSPLYEAINTSPYRQSCTSPRSVW